MLKFCYVPATSAAHNRLLFFFFLLRPFTVLMKKTHAVKQSILGSVEWFKITFGFAHRIPDRILRIFESERIVIRLYSLATNPNTNKPIDIRSRPNINK